MSLGIGNGFEQRESGLIVPVKQRPTKLLRPIMSGKAEGVDKAAKVLRGYVAAQPGEFREDEPRGVFDQKSLELVVALAKKEPDGLKSHFGHENLSADGLGKYLGRSRDFRMSTTMDARTGKVVSAVRADLHFDKTASDTPHGNLADYVINLAESDAGAISSSLVLTADQEEQLAKDGSPLTDENGKPVPPLWRPTTLRASDIVDQGAAVDSLLSPEQLSIALKVGLTPELEKLFRFDNVVRLGSQLLDGLFRAMSRDEVEKKLQGFLRRYLLNRFGEEEPPMPMPLMEARLERLNKLAGRTQKVSA